MVTLTPAHTHLQRRACDVLPSTGCRIRFWSHHEESLIRGIRVETFIEDVTAQHASNFDMEKLAQALTVLAGLLTLRASHVASCGCRRPTKSGSHGQTRRCKPNQRTGAAMPFACNQYESVRETRRPPRRYAMDADEGDPETSSTAPFYASDEEQAAIAYVNRTRRRRLLRARSRHRGARRALPAIRRRSQRDVTESAGVRRRRTSTIVGTARGKAGTSQGTAFL